LSGRVNMIVVLEFCKWEKSAPVILSSLQKVGCTALALGDTFGLTISLGVVGCRCCQLNSQQSVELSHEFRYQIADLCLI